MKEIAKPRKRFGCSPGCFVALVVAIVVASVGGHFALRPVREGKFVESRLNQRFATAPEYVPAADGSISPESLETFIRVRVRLLRETGHVQERMEAIGEFTAIEDEKEITVSGGFDFLRKIAGALPAIVSYVSSRNDALLAEEMGLGEYIHIYALAYGPFVCPEGECEHVTDRTSREIAQMLRNRHEALLADERVVDREALAAALVAEIARLESGERALPWLDGLPAAAEASLAPRREELDALFCAETAEMDLTQKNIHFGGIGD